MTLLATRADLTMLGLAPSAIDALDANVPGAVDRALAAASAVAEGHLATRYVLPLASWGDDLRQAVCALAASTLLTTLGLNPESTDALLVRGREKSALEWLRGVAAKKIHPSVTEGGAPVHGAVVVSSDERGWSDVAIEETRDW